MTACPARVPSGMYVGIPCDLDRAHDGPHRTREGVEWLVVERPMYPERWISVWRNGTGLGQPEREQLVLYIDTLDPRHEDILGILHLHPDGTTTMEAV